MLTATNSPTKPVRYVYDQFTFDPLAEFESPNKEINYNRVFNHPYSAETFSGETPDVGPEAVQLGRYQYFYFNQRNDVTSLLKHNGQSLHSYLYDEYGRLYDQPSLRSGGASAGKLSQNASNFTDPHNHYAFSGKEFDEESELSYFGARSYDSFSGTWTTQDTYRGEITSPASLHRYGFVSNNPINFFDPDGLKRQGIDGLLLNAMITQAGGKIAPEDAQVELYNITNSLSTQQTGSGTVSSQTSANLTLDFSNPKTAITGNFDIVQRYVPTSGVTTVQLAKGKGATEILGPATGGQIAGTEVQGGKVTKLFYQQYTSGGGEKFLTPKAKFAFDEQTALAEAARKEQTIERLVREKEIRELERELSQLEEQYSEQEEGYLKRSLNQLIKGNYSEDVTWLGTGGQVATGLIGIDLPGDIRDIVADLDKWEWTWGHAGQTGLDVIGVLPIVGALKYSDEAAVLIKGTKKMDNTLKQIDDIPTSKVIRTTPKNLQEQLALDEAMKNTPTKQNFMEISDPLYKGTHYKNTYVHVGSDGSITEIHYWENIKTGERSGFKFID